MNTAHITGLDRDAEDDVLLINARCPREQVAAASQT